MSEIILHCPKCDHNTPKLYINIEMSVFNCFHCGFKGKIKQLYKYPELISQLENQISLAEFAKLKSFRPLDIKNVDVLEDLNPVREISYEDPQYDYLLSRGFTEDLINIYRPLVSLNPIYKDRVILPIIENDKIIWFTARSLDPKSKLKYKNPSAVSRKNIVFKSKVPENVLFSTDCVICEGVFDCFKIPNAVSLLGKTISAENQTNLLEFLSNKSNIYVALDEGAEYNINILCKLFYSWFPNKNIYFIDTTKYASKDLGNLSEELNSIQLLQWIKTNSLLYQPQSILNSLRAKLSLCL